MDVRVHSLWPALGQAGGQIKIVFEAGYRLEECDRETVETAMEGRSASVPVLWAAVIGVLEKLSAESQDVSVQRTIKKSGGGEQLMRRSGPEAHLRRKSR